MYILCMAVVQLGIYAECRHQLPSKALRRAVFAPSSTGINPMTYLRRAFAFGCRDFKKNPREENACGDDAMNEITRVELSPSSAAGV